MPRRDLYAQGRGNHDSSALLGFLKRAADVIVRRQVTAAIDKSVHAGQSLPMQIEHQQIDVDRITALLRQHLPSLVEKYHVNSLGVFGSYVRRQQAPESDLDLLVTFDEQPSLLKFIELENYLTDLLGIKVDLVMRDALKPAIGKQILSEVVQV
jgi:uncharacterized protein